jgi:hypothetical protein
MTTIKELQQRIAEQAAEIQALREQATQMPMCIGYISEASRIFLHNQPKTTDHEIIIVPKGHSWGKHPIYIDRSAKALGDEA